MIGFMLQSMRPRHDGRGLIVRYWDVLGNPRRELVKLWGPIARVWRCDLMERPTEELKIRAFKRDDEWMSTPFQVYTQIAAHATETLLIEFSSEA